MKIINKIANASTKQWAIGFFVTGLICGMVLGGYLFIQSILKNDPIQLSLIMGLVGFLASLVPWSILAIVMFLIHLFTKNKSEFISPFQSEIVKDICIHLNDKEKLCIKRHALLYGLWGGLTFAVPISFAICNPSLHTIITAVILGIIFLIFFPFWLRKQRTLLYSTQWAKNQGYKPESIKFFSFNLKKR